MLLLNKQQPQLHHHQPYRTQTQHDMAWTHGVWMHNLPCAAMVSGINHRKRSALGHTNSLVCQILAIVPMAQIRGGSPYRAGGRVQLNKNEKAVQHQTVAARQSCTVMQAICVRFMCY